MSWKRRTFGSVLGLIGFLLSPLTWWNDLLVNIPLAVGFGWLVALLHPPAFQAAVVVGYWLTNIVGLILLHYGTRSALSGEPPPAYSWRMLARDVAISLAYTLFVVVLVKLKLLQPITGYGKG
jgi:hypothetical protein